MKRFTSILCASLLTLVLSTAAAAGTMTGRAGTITGRAGTITGAPGTITGIYGTITGFALDLLIP